MRHWFRDLPIRRKLALMTLASSVIALVFAGAGMFTWDIVQFRREIARDLSALARTIAENSTAAITFEDPRSAGETLAVLEIHPNIEFACMFRIDGSLFATYFRDGPGGGCPAVSGDELDVAWREARIVAPIDFENRRIGTLLIVRDLNDVVERLSIGGGILSALLVLAVALAALIGHRMQRTIADPLLALAKTARVVSETKDYSLRGDITSNDEVGSVVRAFNDMLDRVQERNAELSQANRLKDEFLATLSHELRTPLNAILGWIKIVRAAELPPQTRERALESIERNAALQARLIEDLLEVSRIVTGKLHLHPQRTDLAAIVDAAVEIVQPAATAKNITLTTTVDRRPAMTSGDPDRLQQVIWNLLSNAVKFTQSGGRVDVQLTRDNGYVLTVADNGLGIEPAMLPQMFQPFRQIDASPTREQGGLGLGLAIVRQLVEMHGGTVTARSQGAGTGTTFDVRLPSVLASEGPLAKERTPPAAGATASSPSRLLTGIHVLVVDDEEDARELLRTVFENYGAKVTTAGSAASAVREVDRVAPHVIVSDIGMPLEDGFSLIRRIRARPTHAGGDVPAIALTAYASAADRARALAAGFQAHVAKPFEPEDVARLIHDLTRPALQQQAH
jgi:signal transduction histidine kinase/ActR/RegA family two-component response regulator